MTSLQLIDLTVARSGRRVLDAVNLQVEDGERVAVLGSSGAGKTTLVRTVAGVEPIDDGVILIGGIDMRGVSGLQRGVAMVAQAAELLPHRNVAGNLAFPLELRHLPRDEIDRRVRAQARAFSIGALLGRRSSVLSAGETAEVALARGFVRDPELVLMDEPFARIDVKQRALLIRDVIRIQESYGASLLLATSDAHVAFSIARSVAVLHAGRVVQVGSPRELLEQPASTDVAGLLSDGPLNLLPGRLARDRGRTVLHIGPMQVPTWDLALTERSAGPVQVGIQPADLCIGRRATDPSLHGRVLRHTFLGPVIDVTVVTEDTQLTVRCPRPPPRIGARVEVSVRRDRLHVFDAAGAAIAHGV